MAREVATVKLDTWEQFAAALPGLLADLYFPIFRAVAELAAQSAPTEPTHLAVWKAYNAWAVMQPDDDSETVVQARAELIRSLAALAVKSEVEHGK